MVLTNPRMSPHDITSIFVRSDVAYQCDTSVPARPHDLKDSVLQPVIPDLTFEPTGGRSVGHVL